MTKKDFKGLSVAKNCLRPEIVPLIWDKVFKNGPGKIF